MCGRFDFHGDDADVVAAFGLQLPLPWPQAPTYNIPPGVAARVIYASEHGLRIGWMRFGWQMGKPRPRLIINARGETVQERPLFRRAFAKRRCVVLANGFFEWDKNAKPRQPWYFSPAQGTLFGLAGLWEPLAPSPGDASTAGAPPSALAGRFVVLTTAANARVAPLHDRMPVMLRPQNASGWIVGGPQEAEALIGGYPAEHMRAWPVSSAMNDARNDAAACIAPVAQPAT